MPYDPTKPVENTPLDAAQIRNQFAGLNDLIQERVIYVDLYDGINAGSAGPVLDVDLLTLTISNPPTQAEVQTIVDRFNEALTKLKRL